MVDEQNDGRDEVGRYARTQYDCASAAPTGENVRARAAAIFVGRVGAPRKWGAPLHGGVRWEIALLRVGQAVRCGARIGDVVARRTRIRRRRRNAVRAELGAADG